MLKLNSTGLEFEDTIIDKFYNVCIKEWGTNSFKISTVKQDLYAGTDFFVLGVPVDVTLNITDKNHTTISKTTIDIGFAKINFAVRYGNGRVKFDTPVLVIGFDTLMDKTGIRQLASFLDPMQVVELIQAGMDCYFETVEI
ncbi:hypothetical protein LJB89_02860 [Tyzzerella sp. OttesenSCG-928-J15]|nr:hypothetical protein [Tyzzerella sp. OttesenSCG-928-J15]